MIHHLRALAVFAKTVEQGSFRGAARELQLSPSVVSHHIGQLEQELGVALLYRSTRKLSLTRDGERLIGPARAMVDAAQSGIDTALHHAHELSGQLKLTMPAVMAQSPVTERIARFVNSNTSVRLEIDYSEQQRDMIADGIDIAIRMGWLRDSSLKAKKLYDVERVLIASNVYLQTRPVPQTPKDIEEWDWFELTPVPLKPTFRHPSRKSVTIRPMPRVSANSATALYELSRSGAGLAIVPRYLAEQDLQTGKMRIVLSEWQLPSVGVYAVRPNNSPRYGLATAFVEALM